jgi:DNA-binding transcriptional ArsR family regulator
VSAHLGLLASVGLVWRRRSGRRVYYHLAEQPGSRVVAAVLEALHEAFRIVEKDAPRRVARADQAESATNSDAALFACFTAFTHPRRLQIIRHLAAHGTAPFGDLSAKLSISPRACMRHLDKLERRGYLRHRIQGKQTVYALRKGDGAVQSRSLQAVREQLVEMRG